MYTEGCKQHSLDWPSKVTCDVKSVDTSSFTFNTITCESNMNCYNHIKSDSGQQFVCALPSEAAYTVLAVQPGSIDYGTNLYINDLDSRLHEQIKVTPVANTLDDGAKVCMPIYSKKRLNLMYKDNIFDGRPMFAIPKSS